MKFRPLSALPLLRSFRSTKTPLAIAFGITLLVVLIGFTIDQRHMQDHHDELRANTERMAGLIARRVFARIERNAVVINHLAHAFRDEGGSLAVFEAIVGQTLYKDRLTSLIVTAPDFKLDKVFTLDGVVTQPKSPINGVDLDRLAMDIRSAAGLEELKVVSGSQENHVTIIAPLPAGGGAIAMVMEEQALLQRSEVSFFPQITANHTFLDFEWMTMALRDSSNPGHLPFFGDDSIEDSEPMVWPLSIRGAQWTLMAAPKAGWNKPPLDLWRFRLLLALGGLAVVVPVFVTTTLVSERNRHIAVLKMREAHLLELSQTLRRAKDHSEIKNAELELAFDELSNREQELEELSAKLDLALASSECGVWISDPETRTEVWDARMCQLHGIPFTDGRIPADKWLAMLHPDDREPAKSRSYHFSDDVVATPLVARVPQPDGSVRHIRSIGKLHTARDGSRKIVGIAFDVTQDATLNGQLKAAKEEAEAKNAELELAKTRIEHNALHDPLTLLANRRKLDMELDRLSRSSQGARQRFSILNLDLDRFKQINDTLGHAAGDAMLVHASKVLARNVRGTDIVARIGGDEFVIVATDNSDAEEMSHLAQRIIAEFHQPIDFEGFSIRCGISIGIAQANGMNVDARRVLVNADIALYRAKGLGRNRWEFFTQNLQAEIINQKRTADEMLSGIDNDEFITFYQPQFDAHTNRLTGVEALVRWNHPLHGVLPPANFLNIAKDLNVSAVLDQIVLETVLKDKLRWLSLGIEVPKVSVNVSSSRLHDSGLIDRLKTLSIPPGEISFELVESIFLDESEESVSTNLERIKELGIDIEIDDFGTGHTSIVSLLKLKPKRLKIDRQLVMPILNSPQERALVRSIIEIARSLGVETIAEGVETMQHAAMLRELGCDLLQGYAFSRPLSFSDFTRSARNGWNRIAA